MIFNQHLAKADESIEIRHDNSGNCTVAFIKDGEVFVYQCVHDLVLDNYFGAQVERTYLREDQLAKAYEQAPYDYHGFKKYVLENIQV